MDTTQPPASKPGNSNGGRKFDASTEPAAARMPPPALARDAEDSSNKGTLSKSMAGDQTSKRPKPKSNRAQAVHDDVATSSPKKETSFGTLLQRCRSRALAAKNLETENSKAVNKTLVDIYRLNERAAATVVKKVPWVERSKEQGSK